MATSATFSSFQSELQRLVTRFREDFAFTHSSAFDEANTRLRFIDPFFAALGWELTNPDQPLHNAEVVLEEQADEKGRQKKVDYLFLINRMDKFVCEAKKPAENLIRHAFQIQRYAYGKRLYVGLLTSFEETRLYVVGAKPDPRRPFDAVRTWRFDDYEAHANEIWDLFARDNVANASLEKFVTELPKTGRRGPKEGWFIKPERNRMVDEDFLVFLERARTDLAKTLVDCNPRFEWGETGLNEAVQRILDRILFIRICEDRDIDTHISLHTLMNDWRTGGSRPGHLYPEVVRLFRHLAPQFNGGLFGRPGEEPHFSESLKIDDAKLGKFIEELSSEESDYLFSTIRVEILGSVYERFLGKVIHITSGGNVQAKPKNEAKKTRKSGGVYYTPEYVVNYIVEETVGKLLDGKSPKETAALKILDPACGSGSFLLRAFERICEHHVEWYLAHPKQRNDHDCCRDAQNRLCLTTGLKRRIALNNIFGVDLDPQAVEVAQLSLYLKILEGETRNSLGAQRRLFPLETFLPDLSKNIICGNSLIENDIFDGQLFDNGEERRFRRLRPMNFEDAFMEVMKGRGFDALIGNPPYGQLLNKDGEEYLSQRMAAFASTRDVYVAFIQRAPGLLADGGELGYIVPSAWLGGVDYKQLRELLCQWSVDEIIALPFDVFKDAYIDTVILIMRKTSPKPQHVVRSFVYPKRHKIERIKIGATQWNKTPLSLYQSAPDKKFILSAGAARLLDRLRETVAAKIADYAEMRRGVLFNQSLLTNKKSKPDSHRYFEGGVYRYEVRQKLEHWVELGPKMSEYPKEFKWFEGPRLLLRRLVNRQQRLMAGFTDKTFITNKNLYTVLPLAQRKLPPKFDYFLLAILNSKLISRLYIDQVSQAVKDDFPQVTIKDILNLPFPEPENPQYDKLVRLAERMLDAKSSMTKTKSDADRNYAAAHCGALDGQIDRLVYDLYGLTKEEISFVEEATGRKES
jgi:type I restriction-modification system DNA methylase subunit